MMNYDQQKLKVNTTSHRLELEVEGGVAFIDYKLSHGKLFLLHAEVPAASRGKGVATATTQKSLQYAKDNNYKVIPICGFVQAYLTKHPEWNDVIAPDAGRFIHK